MVLNCPTRNCVIYENYIKAGASSRDRLYQSEQWMLTCIPWVPLPSSPDGFSEMKVLVTVLYQPRSVEHQGCVPGPIRVEEGWEKRATLLDLKTPYSKQNAAMIFRASTCSQAFQASPW